MNTELLTKKERKRYTVLIAEKLESLGVADQIIYIGSGKKVPHFRLDSKGGIIMKDGKPQMELIERKIASNPFRQMIKTLRNGPKNVILAFLATEVPELAAEPVKAADDGILIKSDAKKDDNGEAQGN